MTFARVLIKNLFLFFLLCLGSQGLLCQPPSKVVIADSSTRQGLAFATIRFLQGGEQRIAGIGGVIQLKPGELKSGIVISHAGYITVTFYNLPASDTFFLSPAVKELTEVIIRPDNEKIKRIINRAIDQKAVHNPDHYEAYRCDIYYKMRTDLIPEQRPYDSTVSSTIKPRTDTGFNLIGNDNHIFFSEVFSRRTYKRPDQVDEVVLASRFSGLRKTYFTNLVTDVLPFHVYGDYINLNGRDYIHPLSKGWQQRYAFRLINEIPAGTDTIFMFTYAPRKNANFNGLKGSIYIHTNGYAISHFTGSYSDPDEDRLIRIEQIYQTIEGKWFPRELNYDLVFNRYPMPSLGMKMNGHSIIDSVFFLNATQLRLNKTYPVRLDDSVDLRSEAEWEVYRKEPVTIKEANTYRILDSLTQNANLEKTIDKLGKLAFGYWPIGILEVDLKRIFATNDFEGIRVGTGINTNEKLSKYFSIGGWMGYGTKDKEFKYGGSATYFLAANRDNWIRFSYQKNYQSQGIVNIHREIDRLGFRNWLLQRVDLVREYRLSMHLVKGYWELEPAIIRHNLGSLYPTTFEYRGLPVNDFKLNEASLRLRYAYAEKRVPLFGQYLSSGTKYPVFYFLGGLGKIVSGNYKAKFWKLSAALTFDKHIHRWGNDHIKAEAGIIRTKDTVALSKSYLLAGNGFRTNGLNFYAWGGFLTMHPFAFYSDAYISILYKHDIDWFLWEKKFSKPYLSLAHNMLYGSMQSQNKTIDLVAPVNGYHESGIVLNQLIQKNFLHAFYLYLNAGAFYHWSGSYNWKKNGVFVVGISAGL
jgi:hypothetical protein